MGKYFSDEFLDNLPDNWILALNKICNEFRIFDNEARQRIEFIETYFQALAIFQAFAASKDYKCGTVQPSSDSQSNINSIRSFFGQYESETNKMLHTIYLEQQTKKYADRFESTSAYVFSEDDFSSIQKLINELRDLISKSEIITSNHKRRLLERLERMQQELHKTTSDLDRFWGFIGEAGVVIGKFGNDIKPLIDRIKELADIVWKVIAIKETLLDNHIPILLPESGERIEIIETDNSNLA